MYKMKLLSRWGRELRWCKILYCDTPTEAMILAREKLDCYFISEKYSLGCVTMFKYIVYVAGSPFGFLTIKGIGAYD